jgi:uncharacterized protein (DUF488 family)
VIDLYTCHWRSPLLVDADAQIVSISRGEPRWRLPFRYRRLQSLAPSDEAWRQKDQKAFEAAYIRQLEEIGVTAILGDLKRIAGDGRAVLLCWERLDKPDEWCHRRILADWLRERTGIEIREMQRGDLPHCEEAAEMRLF